MTRCEFLEEIYKESGFLPPHKRRSVMAHFNGLFTGYDSDLDVIDKLGTPQEALKSYLNTSRVTSKIPKPLLIAALLLLSPFILDAAIIVSVLTVVLFLFAAIVLFLIPVLGISLWLDGIEIIFRSIPQAVILADKLWQIGIGFMQFAAGIVILLIVYKLYSKLIPWITGRFCKLHHWIEKKRTK